MFKKLLGVVLALTRALVACSAVFAEENNDWTVDAKNEVSTLSKTLEAIMAALKNKKILAGYIYGIAENYLGEELEDGSVEDVLDEIDKVIGEAYDFMLEMATKLESDDYSQDQYEEDLNTAAASLNFLNPGIISGAITFLGTLAGSEGVNIVIDFLQKALDLTKATEALDLTEAT